MAQAATTSAPALLRDAHDRTFRYLRLSITEACNYACTYCLPDGYRRAADYQAPLTSAEIANLARGMAGLGVTKVRLTGGEPTLRSDLVEVVGTVAATAGITRVALSTNGDRLARLASSLAAAGLTHVNVSVDSLAPATFEHITGRPHLSRVLTGIDAALDAGLSVKVNAVLMRGLNEPELDAFMAWVRRTPVTVRFIELMQTGLSRDFFARHHLPLSEARARLLSGGFRPARRRETDGPADELVHPDYRGGVGFITPYARDFCAGCNRLRVTARGALRLCLFGAGERALRPLLSRPEQRAALQAEVRAALAYKDPRHRLHLGDSGPTRCLAELGG